MDDSPIYDPQAQSPEQRADVLTRMQRTLLRSRKPFSPYIQNLHARYIAGELTWLQVWVALDNEPATHPTPTS